MTETTYDQLGNPVDKRSLRYENWANMRHKDHIMVAGLSCGRVEFMHMTCLGRMTADEAEELGNMLIGVAKAARHRRAELEEIWAEQRAASDPG